MKNNYSINDLVDNPTQRVPICLCLDTSGSMQGEPIKELNKGLKIFFDALKNDEIALYAADVCIITYGHETGKEVRCISDFSGIECKPELPTLEEGGLTPMGEAVNLGLDLLEARKNEYKEKGIDYYQPWLVLMTDGVPYGDKDPKAVARAQKRTTDMVNNKKLVVFPIGIGENADMEELAKFSPKNAPLRLKNLNFGKFFAWLSASVSKTSQSFDGNIKLPKIDWSL